MGRKIAIILLTIFSMSCRSGDVEYSFLDIYKAFEKKDEALLKKFAENKNIEKISSDFGDTILFICIMEDRADILRQLIRNKADVRITNVHGLGLLHVATQYRNVEIVKMLIDAGCDVNARDNHGFTPLFNADTHDVIELLVKSGADLNIASFNGTTILHVLYKMHSMNKEIKYLITKGADPTIKNIYGESVEMMAKRDGRTIK